ncbi:MAG: HDOD domain-containing protein [Rhodoferax sp.]|nr:HDOD domain-containing protein [Rhodoferax sp.]
MTIAVLDRLLLAMRHAKGVPAAERSVASVLAALDSSDQGKHEVVRHIIEDFALTHKVLKLANSSMYAPMGAGAASVTSAVQVLGREAVLHLVLGVDLVSEEDLHHDVHLARTLLASELARQACARRAEDAAIATLMLEIGQLMVGKYLPAEAALIATQVAAGAGLQAASTAVLGLSFQQVGVELATRWNLPQTLRASIDGSGDPLLVGLARFASTAAALVFAGQSEAVTTLLQKLELPGIDKIRLNALIRDKLKLLHLTPPQRVAGSSKAQLHALLLHLLQAPAGTLAELSQRMLPGIASALSAAHCLLFVTAPGGRMVVRSGFGEVFGVGFGLLAGEIIGKNANKLDFTLSNSPTAFHTALQNHVEVFIADVSRLPDSALPTGYKTLLPQVRKFLILPIANSHAAGLLYCDWEGDTALQAGEMEFLRKLRDLLLPYFPD